MQSLVSDFIYMVKFSTSKICTNYQTTYEMECFLCGILCSLKLDMAETPQAVIVLRSTSRLTAIVIPINICEVLTVTTR